MKEKIWTVMLVVFVFVVIGEVEQKPHFYFLSAWTALIIFTITYVIEIFEKVHKMLKH